MRRQHLNAALFPGEGGQPGNRQHGETVRLHVEHNMSCCCTETVSALLALIFIFILMNVLLIIRGSAVVL